MVVHSRFSVGLRLRTITLFTLTLLISVLLVPSKVGAQSNCDCGFQDPQDPTGQVWTTYWAKDFTTMTASDITNDFRYMVGSIGLREFQSSNVAIDVAGLHLTVQPPDVNNSVPSGGIYTAR